MRKFLVLARVQLRALLSAFRIGGSRKKAVSGWVALLAAAGLCVYVSGLYSFSLGGQLAAAGSLELLLLLMPAMAAIAGLVFTAFAAQGVVFGGRDADLLLSMPVSAFTVLLAKLTALYAENLVFCVFLVLPAGAAWLWFGGGGGALFVLRLVVGIPFLTLLPTVLSLAAGFLLSWLGGRFANRKAVNLLLYALLMAAVFFLAIQLNIALAALAAGTIGAEISGAFTGWGIPFLLFQRGVCGDWETLVMFCLLSLAPVLLAAWLFAKNYQQVLTGLRSHGKRPAYRLGRLRAAGRRRALLRKESARYFGTPIYLFNTGIGLILLVIAGIAAAVMGGSLREQLALAGVGGFPLLTLAAAVIGFLLSTVAITGSSISLEGQNLWIIQEAPVSAREVLDAKAGFQLLLTVPCTAVCAAGLTWGLGLSLAEGGILLLFGLAFAGFIAPMGLAANLLFPKLDAVNDMVVVKQSAAAMLSTFGGMGAALACGSLVWTLTSLTGELAALAGCAAALLLGGAVLVRWLHTRGAARFAGL
ncbi:MAG: hypothetical protein K2P20_03160 [Oscillospiraceae bacterium]|nr:hypothetical protein [Oscillospiraceae bacterium]